MQPAGNAESHIQRLQAELRVKAVGLLPAKHSPDQQIHDDLQVEEAFLQRDVGNVDGPHLINRHDLLEIHQGGKPLVWIAWDRGKGFVVSHP
jgi:hypothetical protein